MNTTSTIYEENPLYVNGRFVGVEDSIEHQMHCLRTAYLQAESDAERDEIEKGFAEFQVSAEGEAAAQRMAAAWGGKTIPAPQPVATAATATTAATRKPCAYLTTEDLADHATEGAKPILKGLLFRDSYAVAYGAPGEGKTSVALDLGYAVAQGREWMGRKVNGGIVVYAPFEGAGGLKKRVKALVQKYGHAPNFRAIKTPNYNLRELSGRQAFGEDMRAALGDEKPVLVIIDTIARALKGGDENSAKDMSAFNDAVAALIESTGACVLVLHHSGKDKSKGARGSSSLLGAIDTEIQIDGGRIIPTKQRDVELGAPIGFKLAPVVVGEDADGDEITACIVEPAMASARDKVKPTGQALDAWNVLLAMAPNNNPLLSRDWEAGFARQAWPTNPPEAKSQGRAFQRAVKALVSAGWVVDTGQGWQRPLTGAEVAPLHTSTPIAEQM